MDDPLKVLLVPDAFSWVLGTWAQQIAEHGKRHRYYFFSASMVHQYPGEFNALVQMVDVVHVLTQHGFLHLPLPPDKPVVGTILHVVDWDELRPVAESDLVCYMSNEWREYLCAKGISENRLEELRYGIDIGFFRPLTHKQEARHQLGFTSNEFLVGFFGKYSSDHAGRKGADILVRTLDLLSQKGERIGALITGPGWLPLVRALRATGLSVYYFPFLHAEAMPTAYNALDAYVITSRIEGGPVPLLEAMACGLPVVTTPVGIACEVIIDGVNGLLIPKESPRATEHALLRLIHDQKFAAQIGRAGRETIAERWQWAHTLAQIDALYDKAVQNHEQHHVPVPQHAGDMGGSTCAREPRSANSLPEQLQIEPERQRRSVLLRDSLLWHKSLLEQGYYRPALELSTRVWMAYPWNLDAGKQVIHLTGSRIRQRIGAMLQSGRQTPASVTRTTRLGGQVAAAIESLCDAQEGRFDCRIARGTAPTLLSQCFAVLGLELVNALPELSPQNQERWSSQILECYRPQHGLFIDPTVDRDSLPDHGHNWTYLTWQSTFFALAALDALGHDTEYSLEFLESFKGSQQICRWLEGREWHNPWLESNNVMFLTSFLIQEWERSHDSRTVQTLDVLFEWLDEHQNPITGYWDLGQGASTLNAMAGAFHFYFLYFYTGRAVRYPERILESTLALQQPDGLFNPSGGGGACLDLDAVDILVKFSLLTDYRAADVKAALERAYEAILNNQNPDGGFCEAKRPAPRKSLKRQVAEVVGLDRLLNRPYEGHPVEYLNYSGWDRMRYRVDESDLWSTWFRPLALALISTRYPGEFIDDVDWRFRPTPTLGWHDTDRLCTIARTHHI